jgi:mRNA-degrading endonuclease YafQ of YafQ-DinJ toxin-antitoxin module
MFRSFLDHLREVFYANKAYKNRQIIKQNLLQPYMFMTSNRYIPVQIHWDEVQLCLVGSDLTLVYETQSST